MYKSSITYPRPMNPDLISVIVPIYNVAKYLRACLDSIIHQTYYNLEIILVDDGSTDESSSICDEFSDLDNRIIIKHQKNGGLSDARNTGIEIATGKYITFVDSDDVIATDMIDYLHKLLVENNADMSLCQMRKIDENGRYIDNPPSVASSVVGYSPEECLRKYFTDSRFDTVAWSKLYKTKMFSDVRYPKGKYHEDVFTTYKILAKCRIIAIGGERKYMYRARPNSIMNLSFKPAHMHAIEGKCELNDFIENNYPSLSKYSHAEIVYAANMCSMRIANSEKEYIEFVQSLQGIYRKYIFDYIGQNRSFYAKIFSIAAYVNLNFLIKIIKYARKFTS